jgi:hypothetical protein
MILNDFFVIMEVYVIININFLEYTVIIYNLNMKNINSKKVQPLSIPQEHP